MNNAAIARIPGLGPKTVARLWHELKGLFGDEAQVVRFRDAYVHDVTGSAK